MSIAVIGESHQRLSAAAYLATLGETVATTCLDTTEYEVAVLSNPSTRQTVGRLESTPEDEVEGVLIIDTPETLPATIQAWAPILTDRVVVVAACGLSGPILVESLCRQHGVLPTVVADAAGYPVLGEMRGSVMTIRAVKRGLLVGVPGQPEPDVIDVLRRIVPDGTATDRLRSSLSNTNPLLHPPVAVLNATNIERQIETTLFRDALTPSVSELINAVDEERLRVLDKLGLPDVPVLEHFVTYYGDQGLTGSTLRDALSTFPAFTHSRLPQQLHCRFLDQDVRHGLAPMAALGDLIGVPCPRTNAVVEISSTLLRLDLREDAADIAQAALADV
ncbi:NAD/NADP octopine/nopaline dehydrogenase family protein [Streptomyces sp. NPDC001508]|uniref:NAD/NADP octopine/nopaline dehydrogenase family protein n=1 Tax=Streptomyces sp. NPDC001508 TaxID=3154656 RepID=UPI003322A81D